MASLMALRFQSQHPVRGNPAGGEGGGGEDSLLVSRVELATETSVIGKLSLERVDEVLERVPGLDLLAKELGRGRNDQL